MLKSLRLSNNKCVEEIYGYEYLITIILTIRRRIVVVQMRTKWICLIILFMLTMVISNAADDSWDIFSEEERVWLENHPVIRVAPENDYAPIEFFEDGEFKGLSVDYLNWISEKYQIEMEYVYYETWSDILEALKKNEIDLQSAIVKTEERSEYLTFTDAYADIPNVVLVRREAQFEISEDNLYDYRVGVIEDYAVHEYLRLVHEPDYLHEFKDIRSALTQLSLGDIDVLIVDLAQASYYIQDMAITNIVISSDIQIGYEYKLRFASPKDEQMLTSIMNKAIREIPSSEKHDFMNQWINPGYYSWFDRGVLSAMIWTILVVITFFVSIAMWSLTLKKQVHKKTKELDEELKKSQALSTELQKLTDALEQRVEERSKRLTEANQELEEKIRVIQTTQEELLEAEKISALSRLVIGIAHRINTPLGNGITSLSYTKYIVDQMKELLMKSTGSPQSNEVYELTNEIESSIEKSFEYLKTSSEMVADFNRVANYHYDNDIHEVVLDIEIERIVKIIEQQFEFRNYTFSLDLERGIVKKTSPRSFFHLMSSLIDNCRTHGYLEAEEGEIRISLSQEERKVTLTVSDDGQGIREELLDNVMEPFVTSDLGSAGKGLGLFAAYNIVTGMMGGDIRIESKHGEGTSVKIVFESN